MPKDDNKILKYNHGGKSTKAPFIIHADIETLIKEIGTCHNNSEKLSQLKQINTKLLVIHYFLTVHLM